MLSSYSKITVHEGEWVRSEWPHPLVTLDFDAEGRLLAVVAPGEAETYESHDGKST